ncbi:MAG TPA: ABC transporter permease [Acetivibrio sp.]|uniref:ABC transporter permease n=1 Tax=Acetivibrio sp. TaxID=1872092 RepID=UPI002BA31767|nr:ABC transporter permease [Acetivibrio sp.]HOM02497.1 ABC transporter permease [Acetivibrio sp.]
MFFELVSRNSKRSRKENGLFFASLLISIVAFYNILSLSKQDVMIFLTKLESDAVSKLLTMIPLFYGMTLFILFFLVYFASKFQLERRRHEFGVYLMMGMRRSKLFFMLLAEDFRSSIMALFMGLPIAILLSEFISLVTARLVGLGIVGHQTSISFQAVLWTAIGFYLIKLIAFIILSGKIARQEIGSLLVETPEGAKKDLPSIVYALALPVGVIFLAAAYGMAISGLAWHEVDKMGLTLILGFTGTLLLFFGFRVIMDFLAKRSGNDQKLLAFTFRQLQENVIHRSTTLAISSLLILAGLCCFGAGVAIAQFYGESEEHVLDYTFDSTSQDMAVVKEALASQKLDSLFSELFEMRVGYIRLAEDYSNAFQMNSVMEYLARMPESDDRNVLLNNFSYETYPHLISLSGYNRLLSIAKKPTIELMDGEAAVYMDTGFVSPAKLEMLNQILAQNPEVQIAGENYHLVGTVQSTDLVTDSSITLSFALIVPDTDFERFTVNDYDIYLNAVLNPKQVAGKSLLRAILEANEKLDAAGLIYESYLQNMGRQLFYIVAASYITIYLAIIFLIIANTIIGVQFLTWQQKTGRRYKTLIRLGASYETLCYSAGKQIRWYFGIPTAVAAISSIFGIRALFSGLLSSRAKNNIPAMIMISAAMVLLLCVVECIYMVAVKKSGNRYILSLMVPEREE